MVACQDCEDFSLKKAGVPLASARFGVCQLEPEREGRLYSATYLHECAKFHPADAKVVEKE